LRDPRLIEVRMVMVFGLLFFLCFSFLLNLEDFLIGGLPPWLSTDVQARFAFLMR